MTCFTAELKGEEPNKSFSENGVCPNMSVTGGGRGCDTPILGDGWGSYFKLLPVDLVGLQRETMEIKILWWDNK